MKYYFDTSVWINYFDETEFYHKDAVKWFEKVKEHTLVTSKTVNFEINSSSPQYIPNFFGVLSALHNVKIAKVLEEDESEAYNISKTTEFGYGDLLHLLTAKRYDLVPVTADIHHWPKIARMFGILDLKYITDIYC